MEADWEFEIGGIAPVIDADWPGWLNLQEEPGRVCELAETRMLPGLAEALLKLNQANSPVWTCKTDVFVPDQIDADELAASADEARFSIACYIDLLMRGERRWSDPQRAEEDCRKICARIREVPLRCCRIDLVIRRARGRDLHELGATVYITACGPALERAKEKLAGCLAAFARLLVGEPLAAP